MMKTLALSALALFSLSVARAEDAKLTVGPFSFATPAPWTKAENTGMMTKAILAYPNEGGSAMEAKFYDFGGPSGGIDANIQRWVSSFQGTPEVKKEELDFPGTKVVLLTASGTYMDGMPGAAKTAKPETTLCGAIITNENASVFIKMTGPKAAMVKAQEAFKKLATSPFAK